VGLYFHVPIRLHKLTIERIRRFLHLLLLTQ